MSNAMGMVSTFISLLNSLEDDNEKRDRKKTKLMKVCVDYEGSALKKRCDHHVKDNVKLRIVPVRY